MGSVEGLTAKEKENANERECARMNANRRGKVIKIKAENKHRLKKT